MKRIERTAGGLRDFLFDEIDMFRNGDSSERRLRSAASAAMAIVAVTSVEIEYHRSVKTLEPPTLGLLPLN